MTGSDLRNKVVVITGASKGIGLSIAEKYYQYGAKVVISSRKQASIDQAVKEFKDQDGRILATSCHVGKEVDRKKLIDFTIDHFGRIDVFINNAATNPVFGPIEEGSAELFDKIMEINVKAPWILSNLALPYLKKSSGSIINISSVEGLHPGFGLGLYSMSKSALIMLTKNQAKEWGKFGIRSNAICPGLVKTKFSEALWQNEKMLQKIEKNIPLGRMALPEEISSLAQLLGSSDSSYMTGGVYTVDGGFLLGA